MISLLLSASMLRRLGALVVATIALCPSPGFAHDFWIEPATFSPEPGQIVSLRLRVGEKLLGDPVPRDPAGVNQFVVADASGRKPVYGRDFADPAGILRVERPGLLVIGYTSKPSVVDMTPDKFNQYLMEEGLDSVAALRASRKETNSAARDRFVRCAKSLVSSGSPSRAQGDLQLGFPLELVAERNPYAMRADEDLPLRLTYKNRPLAGALVVAMNSRNPSEKLATRTDHNGRVRFRLRPGGMWLVKAVHTVPAPAGAKAQWESFWASLTFGLRTTNAQGN